MFSMHPRKTEIVKFFIYNKIINLCYIELSIEKNWIIRFPLSKEKNVNCSFKCERKYESDWWNVYTKNTLVIRISLHSIGLYYCLLFYDKWFMALFSILLCICVRTSHCLSVCYERFAHSNHFVSSATVYTVTHRHIPTNLAVRRQFCVAVGTTWLTVFK